MSELEILPIPPERLAAMRVDGHDDHGNPWRRYEGDIAGSPLRCCLSRARADDEIVLIAYSPAAVPGPYAEVGPVFVHERQCAGYRSTHRYPVGYRGSRQVLRCYRADGTQNYDANELIGADDDVEAALVRLLARPDVDVVHVRNVLAGCFMLSARSA